MMIFQAPAGAYEKLGLLTAQSNNRDVMGYGPLARDEEPGLRRADTSMRPLRELKICWGIRDLPDRQMREKFTLYCQERHQVSAYKCRSIDSILSQNAALVSSC